MTKLLSSLMIIGMLTGCGLKDALDATKSMNQTTSGMAQTTSGMAATTNGMAKTTAGMAISTDKMVNSVHNQTLGVAIEGMMKEENTLYLFPPTGMLPFGQIFADEATALDLAKFTLVTMEDINDTHADGVGPSATGTWPSNDVLDRKKTVKLTILQVIAGLTPQATVDQMISDQVTGAGRYRTSVFDFLMLRAIFTDGIMLQESLYGKSMSDPGMFEEGLKYIGDREMITKLSFAKNLSVKVFGMNNKDNNFDLDLTGFEKTVKQRYQEMKDKLAQMDPMYTNSTDPAMVARIAKIKAMIEAGIATN